MQSRRAPRIPFPLKVFASYLLVIGATLLPNGEASAISVAIILSLIASVAFVRRLQRSLAWAQALAAGDYTQSSQSFANDEIGDLERVLQQLSVELRRRLAQATGDQALLVQLVSNLLTPVCVFSKEGTLIAINGAAREMFGDTDIRTYRNLSGFFSSAEFGRASRASADSARPEPCRVELESQKVIEGWAVSLLHPSLGECAAYIGEPRAPHHSILPDVQTIVARPLQEVIALALEQTKAAQLRTGATLDIHELTHDCQVADAERASVLALSLLIEDIIETGDAHLRHVELEVLQDRSWIGVKLPSTVSSSVPPLVGPLVEPLGGKLDLGSKHTTLWLARA